MIRLGPNNNQTFQCNLKTDDDGLFKQINHIISLEPISKRPVLNPFHKLSMISASIDVIGAFWRAMKENCAELSELTKINYCNHDRLELLSFVRPTVPT